MGFNEVSPQTQIPHNMPRAKLLHILVCDLAGLQAALANLSKPIGKPYVFGSGARTGAPESVTYL